MNKQVVKWLIVCVMLMLSVVPAHAAEMAVDKQVEQKGCIPSSKVQLKEQLRRLWMDHVIWTRSYIVSAVAGIEDQKDVLDRLLNNQRDIGNAIKPFYGEAAGNKLTELLREHILIAGQIVDASIKGQQAEAERYNKEWYRNADDISKFLSEANPNWPYNKVRSLLHMHLKLVADELTARLKKDWKGDILAFDKGADHLMVLSDTLAEGLVKQFPKQFR